MSTRARDIAPGKEKRGSSPSHTGTGATQRRRSPNPSKTNSPARSPDSTPSGKNIPNYLKPTLSSANDVPKQQGKKPASTTDSNSTLARRRSFDKPPSPSRTQNSRLSPNHTLRSSSFSGKIGTSQKRESERSLKGPKDAGKQHTLYARPVDTVKKISTIAKKPGPGSGSSRKERVARPAQRVDDPIIHDVAEPELQSDNPIIHEVAEPEPQSDDPILHDVAEPQSESDDQESFVSEEQTLPVENYNEKENEDLVLEDLEPMDTNDHTEGDTDDTDAEIVAIESSIILEQHNANIVMVESPTILENQDAKVVTIEDSTVSEHKDASINNAEELEDKSRVEEISIQQEEIKEQTTNDMNHTNIHECIAGDPNEEVEDKERKKEEEEDKVKEETTLALSKKKEVDSGSELDESEEKEVQVVVVEEKNIEAENSTPGVAHNKKDLELSNNVIEETASKLREQRKNKVKALAGAFESVISLQEPK